MIRRVADRPLLFPESLSATQRTKVIIYPCRTQNPHVKPMNGNKRCSSHVNISSMQYINIHASIVPRCGNLAGALKNNQGSLDIWPSFIFQRNMHDSATAHLARYQQTIRSSILVLSFAKLCPQIQFQRIIRNIWYNQQTFCFLFAVSNHWCHLIMKRSQLKNGTGCNLWSTFSVYRYWKGYGSSCHIVSSQSEIAAIWYQYQNECSYIFFTDTVIEALLSTHITVSYLRLERQAW